MVVFVIAHCRNLQNIAPHRATAAEALISISAVVILKTSDANYHFRVKNGRDYQNDWVAPAPDFSFKHQRQTSASNLIFKLQLQASSFKLQAASSFYLQNDSSFKLLHASSCKLLQASSWFKLQADSRFILLQASSFKLQASSCFKLQASSCFKFQAASSFKLLQALRHLETFTLHQRPN